MLSVNSRILCLLIMSESPASILAVSGLWCYESRASCPITCPWEPPGQCCRPHQVTRAGGEIIPRAWSGQGIPMRCASNPARTHRVGQERDLLLLCWSHLICQTWWLWFAMHYPLPNCWLTKVLLPSLKLHGLHYWRVHVEGATSACLGLMSWELTVLLQPAEAVSCCLSLSLENIEIWGLGRTDARGPTLKSR